MEFVRGPRQVARAPQELLRGAALLRALAQSFSYPDPTHWRAVAAQLRRAKPCGRHLCDRTLRRSLANAERNWSEASIDALRATYARLFLGNGPCPMRETAYGDARRMAGRAIDLADISGFYKAFGLRPSPLEPDLPDHLCSELEFCSWLLVKLAYAKQRRAAIKHRVTARALRAFLQDHLGRWPESFATELRRNDGSSPYARLAEVLAQAVRAEVRWAQARPRPASPRNPADPSLENQFECPRPQEQGAK